MKNTTRISDNSSSTKLRGIQGSFTQSSSFPDVWARDSSTSFPAVYSHSFFALLKPQTIPPPPPPPPTPSGPDSSSVTTLHGVEHTVMPLNFPLGNRSSEDLSFRPIQRDPFEKEPSPAWEGQRVVYRTTVSYRLYASLRSLHRKQITASK